MNSKSRNKVIPSSHTNSIRLRWTERQMSIEGVTPSFVACAMTVERFRSQHVCCHQRASPKRDNFLTKWRTFWITQYYPPSFYALVEMVSLRRSHKTVKFSPSWETVSSFSCHGMTHSRAYFSTTDIRIVKSSYSPFSEWNHPNGVKFHIQTVFENSRKNNFILLPSFWNNRTLSAFAIDCFQFFWFFFFILNLLCGPNIVQLFSM